jgi:hypothetical protein
MTGKRDDPAAWPRGWAEHRSEQARALAARLTPAERLRWLEETMAAMRRWVGRAATAERESATPGQGPSVR